MNINNNEPVFYPHSVLVNKCSGSRNDINNPYAKLCVPKIVKDMDIKVCNLMSRTNGTRHILWHETCACKCRLDVNVCNDKQRWNSDKCRCECKELIDKGTWIMGLFEILVHANVNMINRVMLVNTWIM